MKDGPEGDKFAFQLQPVEVCIDDDGDPKTTMILKQLDEYTPSSSGGRPNATNDIALKALRQAIDANDGDPVSAVTWKTRAAKLKISKGKGNDAQRVAWTRAKNQLIKDGEVIEKDGRYDIENSEHW